MEWIDIKDRQPEDRQKVLVTDGQKIAHCQYRMHFIGTDRHCYYDIAYSGYEYERKFECEAITHWMPEFLPK